MTPVSAAFLGLAFALLLGLACWCVSLRQRDASLADRIWAPMIVGAGWVYALLLPGTTLRLWLLLALGTVWALRLSAYISARNWGQGEDRRYRAMRAAHGERFGRRSLWSVFGLQALLAWCVSAPFLATAGTAARPLGWLDVPGLALAAFGLVYESVADAQLARFKAQPAHRGQVMDTGLWGLSRHPNYFGECCLWWGLGLTALAGGGASAAWCLLSPLLMTVLLLRVSGVRLLERDIQERRPAYADYMARTPAFFPRLCGLRRNASAGPRVGP